jgi:antitoxin ParD1/3/4
MTIELSPELEKLVEAEMQSGEYGSPSEVIAQALRFFGEFHQQTDWSAVDIPNLDALLEEGQRDIKAGRVHDAEEVFDELFAELQAHSSKK